MAAISPPRPPSLREGGAATQGDPDNFDGDVRLLKDNVVRNAKHDDSSFPEKRVADSITPLSTFMRFAVKLDSEAFLRAEEVSPIRADRKLTTKALPLDLPPSEQVPEPSLGERRFLPTRASEDDTTGECSSIHTLFLSTRRIRSCLGSTGIEKNLGCEA